MNPKLDRRAVLKLLSLLSAAQLGQPFFSRATGINSKDPKSPNILFIVFDTLSARHVSVYGYNRETTPNLLRFAEKATVYHSHHAGGNYTTPGTSSILTGTYPWSHRAFQLTANVIKGYEDRNIFHEFDGRKYTRIAYTHNSYAHVLLHQFRKDLEGLLPPQALSRWNSQFLDQLPEKDRNAISWAEVALTGAIGEMPTSLFYRLILNSVVRYNWVKGSQEYKDIFPRGIPGLPHLNFFLEDAMDWTYQQVETLPQPYFAYVHLLPPHAPYVTRKEFVDIFMDSWQPPKKPKHIFATDVSPTQLGNFRRLYDEYIAYTDAEFGRLYEKLHKSGKLDNTWIVFTSDHGEMFERGISGHITPTLYESITHVPLIIAAPGQQVRQDIYSLTSCVDLLPTLLHISGQAIPEWTEGIILPPFSQASSDPDRSIFTVEAKENSKWKPLTKSTVAMIKGNYKLIQYKGYSKVPEHHELYDLAIDPEELNNLFKTKPNLAAELKNELTLKLQGINNRYQ